MILFLGSANKPPSGTAGWRFVYGSSHTMYYCTVRFDSIAWLDPHTLAIVNTPLPLLDSPRLTVHTPPYDPIAAWTRIMSPPLQHPLSPRLAVIRHMDPNHVTTTPAPPVTPTASRRHMDPNHVTTTPAPPVTPTASRRHMDPNHVTTTPASPVAPTGRNTPHGPASPFRP